VPGCFHVPMTNGTYGSGTDTPLTALPEVLAYEAIITVLVTHRRSMQEYLDRFGPTIYIKSRTGPSLEILRQNGRSLGSFGPCSRGRCIKNPAPHVGTKRVQNVARCLCCYKSTIVFYEFSCHIDPFPRCGIEIRLDRHRERRCRFT
jgi:hypothetical protein